MQLGTYLNESRMARIRTVPVLAFLVVASFIAFQSFAASQGVVNLQPGFGQALVAVHDAEMAGAPAGDVSNLVSLLNKALNLNQEALQANTTTERRSQLLAQVDQTLSAAQTTATALASSYRQETNTDRIVAYVVGASVAFLGAILYPFALPFYERYRIERTFDMRVKRK